MDALDMVANRRFGKKQKAEYAKRKAEEELKGTLKDCRAVKKMASAYERKIAEERKRLGL